MYDGLIINLKVKAWLHLILFLFKQQQTVYTDSFNFSQEKQVNLWHLIKH